MKRAGVGHAAHSVMVAPESVPGNSTVFLSGNHDDAKATVTALLESFGWSDVFEIGDLGSARGTEMLMPIWMRMFAKLGPVPYNFKIVR